MNKIKVTLLEVTPEHVVNRAISMPYDSEPSSELTRKVIGVKKHLSCAEHVVMNFIVEGSSRLELQEHMRHRIASPTVKSTRYTIQKGLEFVRPDLSALTQAQRNVMNLALDRAEALAWNLVTVLQSDDIPNDYIKYVLPESLRTSLSWTINLRSFVNFLELRTAENAHFEIRHIAKLMREEIAKDKKSTYIDKILKKMGL